jgi:hypothetical protein
MESAILAAMFPRIEPLPADYPNWRTITELRRVGLELHEHSEWRRLVRSRQWSGQEAAEIVKRARCG